MQERTMTDFIVDWQGDEESTVKTIIQKLICNDLDDGLPTLIVLTGRSGSGKSYTCIKIQKWLYEKRGLDYKNYMQKNIVLSPLDYSKMIKQVLRNPELKEVFTIQIDEGRFVVGAENWGTFINAAIGHVNASARSIKVMATFMITQSLRDIDKRLRDTINLQLVCRKDEGHVFVSFRKFWIDDSDVEKPRLRYRTPSGIIRFKDGTKQRIRLRWRPTMISKEFYKPYEDMMVPIKGSLIDDKMDKLINKIAKEVGENRLGVSERVANEMFENPLIRSFFGTTDHKRWYATENAKFLGLNEVELKEMSKALNKKLKEGVIIGLANKSIE